MDTNVQDMIVYKRMKLRDCLRLSHGWGKLAWFYYAKIRKKAEKETPPATNVLQVGMMQAVVSKDRSFIDKAVKLVEGNMPKTEILRVAGGALTVIGYIDEGLKMIRKAFDEDPCANNTRELARRLREPQDYYEKLILCERLLGESPNDIDALLSAAIVFMNYNRWEESERHIRRILVISPKSPEARELLGDVYHKRGEYKPALREYKKSRWYGDSATVSLLAKIASCYCFIDKYDKARKYALRALKIDANCEYGIKILDEVECRKKLGIEYYSGGYDIRVYPWLKTESARDKPPAESTLFFAAMETVRTKDFRHLENTVKAIGNNMSEDVVLRVSGRTKFDIGRTVEGLAEMRKAVELNPTEKNIINLASCLRENEKTKVEAKQLFMKILSEKPDHYEALWNTGVLSQDENKALDYYHKASAIRPDDWRMYYNMGYSFSCLKRFKEAVDKYIKARHLCDNENPTDISIGLARCYLSTGDYQKALKETERALVEDPQNDEARELLSEIKSYNGSAN